MKTQERLRKNKIFKIDMSSKVTQIHKYIRNLSQNKNVIFHAWSKMIEFT